MNSIIIWLGTLLALISNVGHSAGHNEEQCDKIWAEVSTNIELGKNLAGKEEGTSIELCKVWRDIKSSAETGAHVCDNPVAQEYLGTVQIVAGAMMADTCNDDVELGESDNRKDYTIPSQKPPSKRCEALAKLAGLTDYICD